MCAVPSNVLDVTLPFGIRHTVLNRRLVCSLRFFASCSISNLLYIKLKSLLVNVMTFTNYPVRFLTVKQN